VFSDCFLFLIIFLFELEIFAKKKTRKAQEFILANFCKVANSEDFLELNNTQLTKLIRNDELGVPCESVVFQAVVNWVKHDPESRRCFLDHLFRCVRFHFLPPKFLKEQMNNNDLLHFSDTLQTKQYLQDICDQLISHSPCLSSQVPRKPTAPFSLYVIGGYQRQSISTVECFKCHTMTWERCADMKIPRSGICCVSLALYIYAIGGRNNNVQGNTDCADVECYDPFTNCWRECAPMNIPRSRAGLNCISNAKLNIKTNDLRIENFP
jgi:kelch-like protein 19